MVRVHVLDRPRLGGDERLRAREVGADLVGRQIDARPKPPTRWAPAISSRQNEKSPKSA
jgi:hypothetical protein